MLEKEEFLITAGGAIRCRRCDAYSKRTKTQCSAPAERGHTVCRFHGSRSTGAKSQAGKIRSALGRIKHGESTDRAREVNSVKSAFLRGLEDSLHLIGASTGNKTRGRKPNFFSEISTIEDIEDLLFREK
jgi:hypothetical protein